MEVTTINPTPAQQQTSTSNKSNSNSTMSNDNNLQSQAQIILTNLNTTSNNTMINSSPATKSILQAKPTSACTQSTTNLNNIATNNSNAQHHNSICANSNGTTPMLSNRTKTSNNNSLEKTTENSENLDDNRCCEQLYNDIKYILDSLLDRLTSDETIVESNDEPIATNINSEIPTALADTNSVSTTTLSQTSSFVECGADVALTTTSIIAPVHDLDEEEADSKDIVTLRNLEITPPPQPLPSEESIQPTALSEPIDEQPKPKSNKRTSKRTHSESNTEQDDDQSTTGGRSKRQRRQTQLFQVEDNSSKSAPRVSTSHQQERQKSSRRTATPSLSAKAPISTTKSKKRIERASESISPPQRQDPPHQIQLRDELPDVIFYEKNDYLAIRNEEDTFYLCQLTENVRVQRPQIKVRWLDTRDNGKTYFLTSHYDKVPQKSILMPVQVTKLKSDKKGQQIFELADEVKETIIDRLRRSLNFPSESEQ